ncbi:hypothetical protein [Saccharothrix xinjiangensis]|uniref:Type VII secretion system (Wss) protein ESAT-6 n=1 Tax=Saccharothrix xinjiangensis TaxID=204798 RepID=A0ABV9XQ94_9PSEU
MATAANPLGMLASAGVGWLLEHISFLREPLDALLGDAFKREMEQMAAEYEALGKTMDGAAAIYALSGALVCELRSLVFGWISDLVGELIAGALIAAASAVVTVGSSIAAYAGCAGTSAAMMATRIAGRLSKPAAAMSRFGGRMAQLAEKMSGLVKGLERFAKHGGYAKTAYDAVKPYEMSPATV